MQNEEKYNRPTLSNKAVLGAGGLGGKEFVDCSFYIPQAFPNAVQKKQNVPIGQRFRLFEST